MDIVSPNLRLQILTGQDINLPALLLPDINSDQPDLTFHNIWPVTADARLQCSLSISEFVTAFSIYKRIMCGAYPQRSKELDWYLCDIVDIASKFGDQAAYEYHKLFSARAASLLTERKIKVDWSYRDQAIFSLMVSGRPAFRCDLCKSVSHRAKFCSFNAGHAVKFSLAAPLMGGSTHADTNSHGTPIPWYSTIPCQKFQPAHLLPTQLQISAYLRLLSSTRSPSHIMSFIVLSMMVTDRSG